MLKKTLIGATLGKPTELFFSMKTKKQILFPKHQKVLEQLGENIKLARKRRGFTTIQVSERAGRDRKTLYRIEKGDPKVTLGAYFNVLCSWSAR